ncbi:OLC1v1037274C1 [Oldenlandia corymbosa var. corymbosa]|uniref:OLC1v1037274C1 n=1 Tax=Oldenlandia corymbosa var. corymbosa TaxID=529605 RepID=A0AAV1CX73_OLDCO|nr:OLC1v1037274C1 [Oldenlandia corymbosa var. corymbosa]
MDNEQEEENTEPKMTKIKRKELGFSCMLNSEVGAILAVIRRVPDSQFYHLSDDNYDSSILQSLKSLRSLIFNPDQEWGKIDPSVYLSPFLDVIQSDDVPIVATGVALSSLIKILRLEIFDKNTPGSKDIMNAAVTAIQGCRVEKTDPLSEEAIMMRILHVLTAIMRHSASVLLSDHSVCTVVNTCFQVIQQSAYRGNLLQRSARYTMQELIQIIFYRLPDVEANDQEESESDTEDGSLDSGFGLRAAVDIFHFLCSLLNVVEAHEPEALHNQSADADVQLFSLLLINSAIELSGDSIGKHRKLLRMVQDDLFHHLVHYGAYSSPLVLSMICSTVLNIYQFLRRSVRLQLEGFFSYVLFRASNRWNSSQLQEIATEAIVNFCRQPNFTIEVYVNYDCDPCSGNIFEEIGKLLCKHAFPTGGPLTSLQVLAFEGLIVIIHNIADRVDKEDDDSPSGPYPVEISEYKPFWEEVSIDDGKEAWVDSVRLRKAQKKKILISANHFNQDDKKGLEYLKISKLIPDPPDPKAYALYFHCTPGLDKTMIGEYLGDPDEFHIQVLKEFTETFEFTGMILDSALRIFLETFRLPGESQKIHRILEAFSDRFYDQQSSEVFVSKDAVFVLCYSVIMLNTDQHNPQVKKKMTEEEFIRNNRQINGGNDLPREYLSDLFQSISSHAITVFGQSGGSVEMNPNRWIQLVNRAKRISPFVLCDFDRRLGRDMFAAVAGPAVATLAAIFEQTEEDEILHECVEVLFSIARIAQYNLEDTLDELISSFCKFTTLLNPYASAEETLYAFSNDMKPRMATLAVFTIANTFKNSIGGSWRTIVDCLLKLRRLKLLPQPLVELDANPDLSTESGASSVNPTRYGHARGTSGLIGRFSHFLSLESVEESLNLGVSEFEQNQKIIQQCHIENIFTTSSSLPDEALLNLGRALIYAAAGKKFSTPVEEEETVEFCWDLIVIIAIVNMHRFSTFWPHYHDYLLGVAQFPVFSPIPFAEKAIVAQMKICLRVLSEHRDDKLPEELIFKSMNFMWKLEKEILDTCSEYLIQSITKILTEYPANLQSSIGWKTVLHLLSTSGRHPETYEQSVESLINLMSAGTHISRTNYAFCIECAFGFVALRNSPVEMNVKIMDLMSHSVKLLVQWYGSGYSDPGSNASVGSNSSSTSLDDNAKSSSSASFVMNLFVKLGEALRKTCLARREEVRNHAVLSLQRSFMLAEELCFTPANCVYCFNCLIFAMADDIHEKMLEYSRRENAERETRSMESSLKLAMEVLTDVYCQLLKPISESPHFRPFWMGLLRRMDTCMKADLGEYGKSTMEDVIPTLLKKIISAMKEHDLLVPREGDDLWEITYVQIQWIAPTLKDELFPDAP